MSRKLFVVMAVVLWGWELGVAPCVSAQPVGGPGERVAEDGSLGGALGNNEDFAKRREQHFEEMSKELNLTTEQREKIEAQRKLHMEEAKMLLEQIFQLRSAIGIELQKPQLDLDKIKQMHGQLKEMLLKREDLMFSGILEIREILTLEQFLLFHQKMGQMRKMYKDRGKMDMPPPPMEEQK